MALRRNVGIAFALAVGMALGYAVKPSAQAPDVRTLRLEAVDGRVRVTFTDAAGTSGPFQAKAEATQFEITLSSTRMELSGTDVIADLPDGGRIVGTRSRLLIDVPR